MRIGWRLQNWFDEVHAALLQLCLICHVAHNSQVNTISSNYEGFDFRAVDDPKRYPLFLRKHNVMSHFLFQLQ